MKNVFIKLMTRLAMVLAKAARDGGVSEGMVTTAASILVAAGARSHEDGVRMAEAVLEAIKSSTWEKIDGIEGTLFPFSDGGLIAPRLIADNADYDATPYPVDELMTSKIAGSSAVALEIGGDGLLDKCIEVDQYINLATNDKNVEIVEEMLRHHAPRGMSDGDLAMFLGMTFLAFRVPVDRARIIMSLALAGMNDGSDSNDGVRHRGTLTKH